MVPYRALGSDFCSQQTWRHRYTSQNPDTAFDFNPRPIHFQRGALGGSAESLDASTDPSRDEVVEVMEVKPNPRPLERAGARYAVRMGRSVTS